MRIAMSDLFSETPKCDEIQESLYSFLAEELDEAENKAILDHLLTCEECRQALNETIKVTGLLHRSLPFVRRYFYSTNN